MANNRLYIRCKQCGALCFLGKHFGENWNFDKDKQGKELEKFFFEHCFCEDSVYADQPFNSFELVSEFGQGYPRIIKYQKRTRTNGEEIEFCFDEDLDFSEQNHYFIRN